MKLKTIEQIKEKYNYNNTQLLLHYIALSGEISLSLIKRLNIKKDNMHYIFNKGKYNACFINKRQNKLLGYQLTSKGSEIVLNCEKQNDYSAYLINSTGNIRRTTNDYLKRKRYQNTAELLFALDKLDVEYINLNNNSNRCFITALRFKNRIKEKYKDVKSREKHEIKSSRIYGVLKASNIGYPVYIFNKDIGQLDYSIELRTNTLINVNINNTTDGKTRGIIISNNTDAQQEIIKVIFEAIYSIVEKYKDKKYTIYKTNMFKELFITSFDNNGLKELTYILNKNKIDNMVECKMKSYERKQNKNSVAGLKCDMYFNGYPVIYLMALDVYKLRGIYDIIKEHQNIGSYIVCFKHQKEFISEFFDNALNRVKIIAIEDMFDKNI